MCYLPVYEHQIIMSYMCGKLSFLPLNENLLASEKCDFRSYQYIMCEDYSRPERTAGAHVQDFQPIQIATSSNFTSLLDTVQCPEQHFTYVFLACDMQAACYTQSSLRFVQDQQLWDVPSPSVCPAPVTSLPPSFACRSGQQRVAYTMVCDFLSDCSDGSDEDFCVFPPCTGSQPLQCADGKEVSGSRSCNLACHVMIVYIQ